MKVGALERRKSSEGTARRLLPSSATSSHTWAPLDLETLPGACLLGRLQAKGSKLPFKKCLWSLLCTGDYAEDRKAEGNE